MRHVTEYSKQELNDMLKELTIQFQEAKKLNLKLNMARGKPAAAQLDMNMGLLEFPEGCTLEDGTDARNYGVLEGIPECRRLLGQLLGLKPDQIIIGGNSSLNLMFDTMAFHCLFGTQGEKPWSFYAYEGSPVKFLCPVPGYDRHFQICEELGIQMIPVPLMEDGPDMEMVEAMVREDASIKVYGAFPFIPILREYATATGWWTAWRLWRRLPRISGYSGIMPTVCTIFTRKCPSKISWMHVRPAAIQTGLTISSQPPR